MVSKIRDRKKNVKITNQIASIRIPTQRRCSFGSHVPPGARGFSVDADWTACSPCLYRLLGNIRKGGLPQFPRVNCSGNEVLVISSRRGPQFHER